MQFIAIFIIVINRIIVIVNIFILAIMIACTCIIIIVGSFIFFIIVTTIVSMIVTATVFIIVAIFSRLSHIPLKTLALADRVSRLRRGSRGFYCKANAAYS